MLSREDFEVRDQSHLMIVEGCQKDAPEVSEIRQALFDLGYKAENIQIDYDSLMQLYRWVCDISKLTK